MIVGGGIAALVFMWFLFVKGDSKPDPQDMAELACIAESVALDQVIFADPVPFKSEFDDRLRALQAMHRSLNRSHAGRYAQEFRRFMIQAEERRDKAVAISREAFVTSAWAEVQRCHDAIRQGG